MPLGVVHAADDAAARRAGERLIAAYTIGVAAPRPHPVIADRLTA
jgi:thymidine phosphorylase